MVYGTRTRLTGSTHFTGSSRSDPGGRKTARILAIGRKTGRTYIHPSAPGPAKRHRPWNSGSAGH
eukprot:11378488-Heterocapsa_arctica.AAC.1